MAIDIDNERDYSPEALKEREKARQLDDVGADPLSASEQATLDQIGAGLRNGDEASEPGRGGAQDTSSDSDSGWKTNVGDDTGKKRGGVRGWISGHKKQAAIGGGIIGLLIGGGFGIFGILQGPFQLVHVAGVLSSIHFSRNNEASDISARRLYNTLSGQREKNRLNANASRLVQKHRDRMAKDGITLNYETETGARRSKIQSIEIDPDSPKGKHLLGRAMAEGVDLPPVQDGKITLGRNELHGTGNNKVLRSLADGMVELDGKKGIRGALASRRLKKIMGADYSARSITRRAGESLRQYYTRSQDERGVDAAEGNQTKRVLEPGQPDPDNPDADIETDQDVIRDRNNAKDLVDDVANTSSPTAKKNKLRRIRTSGIFKTGASAAAVVAVACAVKEIGDNIPGYKVLNVLMPLVRMNAQYFAIGSLVQAGGRDNLAEEAGSYADAYYEEDTVNEDGTINKGSGSIMGSALIQQGVGGVGGVMPDSSVVSQISSAYNAEKPSAFELVDSIPSIGTACNVNNWVGNIPGIKQFGEFTSGITNRVASVLTGKSVDDWMADLVAVLAGGAIDTVARGGTLGNLLSFGGRLAANTVALAAGGIELTAGQLLSWDNHMHEVRLAQKKNQSISERLFDMNSVDSLASIATIRLAGFTGVSGFGNMIQTAPSLFMSGLANSMNTVLGGRVMAQSSQDLYGGVPVIAMPLEWLEHERYEDMYVNIDRFTDPESPDYVIDLPTANSNWGHCFGNPIDDQANIIDKEADAAYQKGISNSDCKGYHTEQSFQDYAMFIEAAHTITLESCLELEDTESCAQLGMGGVSSSTQPTGGGTGEAIPLGGHTIPGLANVQSVTACAGGQQPGTTEVGIYVRDRFRPTNSSVEGYNCRPRTTNSSSLSVHSSGRAIDQNFLVTNPDELQRANELFGWLLANAESIGIQYVKYWKLQWSPNMGLSCVTSASDIRTHSNHIHYELNPAAAQRQTPWFTQRTDNTPFTINQDLCQ